METVLNSFLLVALGEMGDKTQLLALILALRFKKPWPIMGGILVATLLNHLLAAFLGTWVSLSLPPHFLRIALTLSFLAFAIWILIPDKQDEQLKLYPWGPFWTTAVVFFLAEMGDKTQLATLALGARYQSIVLVTIGTTLGMMVTDGLAVFLGESITKRVSMTWMHRIAALLCVACAIGAWVSLG